MVLGVSGVSMYVKPSKNPFDLLIIDRNVNASGHISKALYEIKIKRENKPNMHQQSYVHTCVYLHLRTIRQFQIASNVSLSFWQQQQQHQKSGNVPVQNGALPKIPCMQMHPNAKKKKSKTKYIDIKRDKKRKKSNKIR